jgi:hypothetical protein
MVSRHPVHSSARRAPPVTGDRDDTPQGDAPGSVSRDPDFCRSDADHGPSGSSRGVSIRGHDCSGEKQCGGDEEGALHGSNSTNGDVPTETKTVRLLLPWRTTAASSHELHTPFEVCSVFHEPRFVESISSDQVATHLLCRSPRGVAVTDSPSGFSLPDAQRLFTESFGQPPWALAALQSQSLQPECCTEALHTRLS